jgi:hypothetical protein
MPHVLFLIKSALSTKKYRERKIFLRQNCSKREAILTWQHALLILEFIIPGKFRLSTPASHPTGSLPCFLSVSALRRASKSCFFSQISSRR